MVLMHEFRKFCPFSYEANFTRILILKISHEQSAKSKLAITSKSWSYNRDDWWVLKFQLKFRLNNKKKKIATILFETYIHFVNKLAQEILQN